MKSAPARMFQELQKDAHPEPAPDMTDWTYMEQIQWHAAHRGLSAMIREANESDEPFISEVWDAEEARSAAILAERAARAATERLAEHPGSAAAQINARATREAADKAKQAAEDARRIAEEAKLRPPPPKAERAMEAKAPTKTPTPTAVSEEKPKPKRQRKRREPGMPKPQKQWWEERAQWRMRGPQDEDERRGRPMYQCLVDYDPLEWFEREQGEDCDPLE
jgi:hypothetical protein